MMISTKVVAFLAVNSVVQIVTSAEMTLEAGLMSGPVYAEKDEDGNFAGFHFDLIEAIKTCAKNEDDVDLTINIDTDNVLSDTYSYNEALDFIKADCTEGCYDIILADYYVTAERSPFVTFLPPYAQAYVSTMKLTGGTYDSLEAAIAGGGNVCLTPGTAIYEDPAFDGITIVDCDGFDACLVSLGEGTCDLFADDVTLLQTLAKDDISLEVTNDVIGVTYYVAYPMKSDLEPSTAIWMTNWMSCANDSGETARLQEKWFGSAIEGGKPDSITISAGLLAASPPFASPDEDGNFVGIQLDIIEKVKLLAAQDGVDLIINIDTDNVLSDTKTYNEALNVIATDCTEDCDKYHMIVADYFVTQERSKLVTFLPPFLTTFIGTMKKPEGEYDSLEDLIAGSGNLCLRPGTAFSDDPTFDYDSVVECNDIEACVESLKDGDCDLFADDALILKDVAVCDDDLELTTDELVETYFIGFPMKSDLDASTHVWMTHWFLEANANGDVAGIVDKYYGDGKECPTPPPTPAPTPPPTPSPTVTSPASAVEAFNDGLIAAVVYLMFLLF